METDKYPDEVTEAIELYRKGKQQESRDCLRDFLLQQPSHINVLLWLAKVTPDPWEAKAAAELALKLDPANEIAQRAVISVRKRAGESPRQAAERAELSAAVALSTGMTLAQARTAIWSFQGINRPIGEVLDDGTITLRDLGWAVEHAWNARIRDAVKTILLMHLVGAEPKEPPRPLRVVFCSRFTEQQERWATILSGCIAGAAMALSVEAVLVGITGLVFQFGYGRRLPGWIWLVTFVALGLAWGSKKLLEHFMDQADQYRTGRRGEEKVVDMLRYALDDRWTLFRNFEWPSRRWGDVDLILVGSRGVWAFEVKAYSGQVRNIGDCWQRKARWGWRKLTTHPGKQARQNAKLLKKYLENRGVDVRWVEPVVAWAGEPGSLIAQDPATPVWDLEGLPDHVEDLWQRKHLPDETVQQVVEILERAVQAAKEQE